PTDPGGAGTGGLYRSAFLAARTLRPGAAHHWRHLGIHSGGGSFDCCRCDPGCGVFDELPPRARRRFISRNWATYTGLSDRAPNYGKERGIASPGANLWRAGGRRSAWGDRRIPFHSDYGEHANRLATLANLRGEAQIWSPRRLCR